MLSLIQSYPDLVRSVERLASRSLPQIYDFLASSSSSSSSSNEATSALLAFPRETKQRLEAMAKLAKYEEVVAVKDRIIWELTQGRKQVEEKLAEEKVIIDGKRGDCACACLDVWMFGCLGYAQTLGSSLCLLAYTLVFLLQLYLSLF